MVKSGSMVTGCPDRPEHRMQISHRDATLRPNLSPKLHARQPKLVYSELFRASLGVLGGVYNREDESIFRIEEVPTALRPVVKTRQMIDLGIVYKAHTVVEAIEHLLRQRGELPTVDAT